MDPVKTSDIAPYLCAWKRRIQVEEEEERKRAERALQVAFAAAKFLVEEGKAKRVYLFGSLAFSLRHRRGFGPSSDIDLAAEGISPGEYFRLLAEVNRMGDFEVDLVDLDACLPLLKETILRNGVLLYGEKGSGAFASWGNRESLAFPGDRGR
jgi:predicted nucleotidyltransferase